MCDAIMHERERTMVKLIYHISMHADQTHRGIFHAGCCDFGYYVIAILRERWHYIIDSFEICTSAPPAHWVKAGINGYNVLMSFWPYVSYLVQLFGQIFKPPIWFVYAEGVRVRCMNLVRWRLRIACS